MDLLRVLAISSVVGLLVAILMKMVTPCPECAAAARSRLWEEPPPVKKAVASAATLDDFLEDDFD